MKEKQNRRGLFALGLTGAALGLSLSKKAAASILGEENGPLVAIATTAEAIKTTVVDVKKSTDAYLKEFNSYVDNFNTTMSHIEQSKRFAQDIANIEKIFEEQKKQIEDFTNSFVRHNSEWTKIRLTKAPRSLVITKRFANYATFIDSKVKTLNDSLKRLSSNSSSKDANWRRKYHGKQKVLALTSNAHLKMMQSKLLLEELKIKREENRKKLASAKLKGDAKKQCLDSLAQAEQYELTRQLLRQQILTNELLAASIESNSLGDLVSFDSQIASSKDFKTANNKAEIGDFEHGTI
ncbi:MAG: hypothetical protein AB8G05_06900 [Oligoflexales bacterium]